MDLKSIEGVELFAAGKWNGDSYSESDLDDMVSAYNETSAQFRPFVKIGHNDDQEFLKKDGLPAAGYLANLRRIGGKLVADIVDMPNKVYELMKRKAYEKRSAEIYWNIEMNGKRYPRMVKGLALLGADMPAVSTLSDILNLYGIAADAATYEKSLEEKNNSGVTMKEYSFEESFEEKQTEKKMEELEKKYAEAQAKLIEIEAKNAQVDADAKKYAQENQELKDKIAASEQEKADLEIKNFAKELESEKLITPAMRPLVEKLVGPEEKEYSVGENKSFKDKKELLKEVLKLHSEASKVNLDEDSDEGKKDVANKEDALTEKIEAYAKENKVSFSEAYKAVQKTINQEVEDDQ